MFRLMRPRPILFAAALSANLAISSTTYASDLDPQFLFDLGFNTHSPTDDVRLSTWVPSIGVVADINSRLQFSGAWGMVFLDADLEGSNIDSLNPFFSLRLSEYFRNFRFSAGVGLTLPVADGDGFAGLEALGIAAAMRGNWDPWLYAPDTMSFVIPLRAEFNPVTNFTLAGDVAAFLLYPLTSGQESTLGLQGAAEGTFHLRRVDLGLRFQAVRIQDYNPNSDDTQTSVEPYLKYNFRDVSLRAAVTVNLNEANTFSYSPQRLWAAHVGLSWYF